MPHSCLYTAADTRPVYGIRLGFTAIAFNDPAHGHIGRSDYVVDVTDVCSRRILFNFSNREPGSCRITGICFSEADLFSLSVHIEPDTVAAGYGPDSRLPPMGNNRYASRPHHDSTTFRLARGCPDGTGSVAAHAGIHQGEALGVVVDLQIGTGFADIILALSRGTLNIGLRITDRAHGASGILINESGLTLSPALE